jgi:hypothetical protein
VLASSVYATLVEFALVAQPAKDQPYVELTGALLLKLLNDVNVLDVPYVKPDSVPMVLLPVLNVTLHVFGEHE